MTRWSGKDGVESRLCCCVRLIADITLSAGQLSAKFNRNGLIGRIRDHVVHLGGVSNEIEQFPLRCLHRAQGAHFHNTVPRLGPRQEKHPKGEPCSRPTPPQSP